MVVQGEDITREGVAITTRKGVFPTEKAGFNPAFPVSTFCSVSRSISRRIRAIVFICFLDKNLHPGIIENELDKNKKMKHIINMG
jgi:hypothetical protein